MATTMTKSKKKNNNNKHSTPTQIPPQLTLSQSPIPCISRTVSKKKRNKATIKATVSKLHQLPISRPTGVGAVVASIPNRILGQGKRRIWIGKDRCAAICGNTRTNTPTTNITNTTTHPTLERQRAARVFALRKLFRDQCGKIPPPPLAFERWFQTNEMAAITSLPLQQNSSSSIALQADLIRASMDPEEAQRIVTMLNDYACTTTAATSTTKKSSSNISHVVVCKHRHTLDLHLVDHPKHILKLNHEHYDKLQALWSLTTTNRNYPATTDSENDGTTLSSPTTISFHNDLYCLLARYYSIQGPGFQAACPDQVFEVLHQSSLQVQHECFASPLNCYYGSYCSAYAIVDAPFGSSGSFWDFVPPKDGGSFQANPPFVPQVMKQMVDKILTLLQQDENVPLSFVVIVPVWLDDEAYQVMVNDLEYTVQQYIIAKADHGFCDGAQHQRQDRYRVSPYDTAVFVLQNQAGRKQYRISTLLEQELRVAFASGVPTAAAMERRTKRGRGDTDEDGGGGVYQGKKQNRTGVGVEQRRQEERMEQKRKNK